MNSSTPINDLLEEPITMDNTPVPMQGDALSPVMWRGRQWAVTTYGIERLNGQYVLSVEQIQHQHAGHTLVEHVCGKQWVDTDDFATAWLVAMSLHGTSLSPNEVQESLRRMRQDKYLIPIVQHRTQKAPAQKSPRRRPQGESQAAPGNGNALPWE